MICHYRTSEGRVLRLGNHQLYWRKGFFQYVNLAKSKPTSVLKLLNERGEDIHELGGYDTSELYIS